LQAIIAEAYATFSHEAVAPLIQLGPSDWVLELFHGPTMAFKDVAMQLIARLMDRTLRRRGRRATIVGATSGDTGGAAIEAFKGRDAVDIFILFPRGRVSDVQRRQMTTPAEGNVHALAIDGTFDDCQSVVKALFNDHALRDRLQLAGVNSINWARIMSQIVYYFTAAVALGAPYRTVRFCVPTGNFGDIFAGYVAASMGLPIERLLIATNTNDILVRTFATGRYEMRGVVATSSPSMDIQISSNFERLLFDLAGRDPVAVTSHMQALQDQRSFALRPAEHQAFARLFGAGSADEPAVSRSIARTFANSGYLPDPHTAVGLHVAQEARASSAGAPTVTLATAHPAKFPEAVRAASGRLPPEPQSIARQRALPERVIELSNDVRVIADFITSHTRAQKGRHER
jgi:threonine synthase